MANHEGRTPREIRQELDQYAAEISEQYDGAPVVVAVAGSKSAGIPATTIGAANLTGVRETRMRDRLGILQAAIQIEALRHLLPQILDALFKQRDIKISRIVDAVQKIAHETGTSVDL